MVVWCLWFVVARQHCVPYLYNQESEAIHDNPIFNCRNRAKMRFLNCLQTIFLAVCNYKDTLFFDIAEKHSASSAKHLFPHGEKLSSTDYIHTLLHSRKKSIFAEENKTLLP